jgi:hypothetical protein
MGYRVLEFAATPNPNALKCVLDGSPAPQSPRSYVGTGPDAAVDPLGAALMAVPGVRNVLIHDGWVSVGKTPEADWKPIKAAVKQVLGDAT